MTQLKPKNPKGFTLIELMIVVSVLGMLGAIVFGAITGKDMSGKTQCLQSGGQWTEGRELGHYTALCTYRASSGN